MAEKVMGWKWIEKWGVYDCEEERWRFNNYNRDTKGAELVGMWDGIDGDLICGDLESEHWQPHLDTHLGQTFQCVKKFLNKGWLYKLWWNSPFQEWVCDLEKEVTEEQRNKGILYGGGYGAKDKSPALAILTAIWMAKEGEK